MKKTQTSQRGNVPPPITIDRIEAFALTARPSVGPVSSLGMMPVRNGVLVAITSKDGATGWGEVWCNFPPRGNLARLNLLEDVIAPYILGKTYEHFDLCRKDLETQSARMAIHTGEFGPFKHCIAGIDTAMADLAARTQNVSLAEFLSKNPKTKVPVYASTPNVSKLSEAIGHIVEQGHTGVKLKIGLGLETDLKLMRDVAAITGNRLRILADANQNWSLGAAQETLNALSDFEIGFIEEPLRADAAMEDWAALADAVSIPLAGGENITSLDEFARFAQEGKLKVVQPDVAKWGGVSGAMEVASLAAAHEATCALHYMGTGLGLAASIHTLAAIGGNGPVELDSNPNPLRTDLGDIDLTVTNGMLGVPAGIGHGFLPDSKALETLSVARFEAS
ncbi:mandelate racemase/muconate lactonizing enzyme family protein [Tateyamaria sp.]|uniref:mandelate racemase/muconate lactonizing enzyme family protein n=1 Tax=Tateyamaria sp. TaxID=1929288 RepID=UPI00329DE6DA